MAAAGLQAATAEKDGIRVDAVFKTVERADGSSGAYIREIDRTLTLRSTIKIVGFKPLPAGTIEWTLLVRRWGAGEVGRIERIAGTLDLQALRSGEQVAMDIGEFQIGGHLHGSAKHHVDSAEAWRLVFVHEGQRREVASTASFGALEKRAGGTTRR